ncbi:MAG: hypothetical protein R3F28_12290 [Candidatus Kapaibacterium sp.]
MLQIKALPQHANATPFIFNDIETYESRKLLYETRFAEGVTFTFSIHSGREIDRLLFTCSAVTEETLSAYLEAVETWNDNDKYRVIVTHSARRPSDFSRLPGAINVEVFDVTALQEEVRYRARTGHFGNIPHDLDITFDMRLMAELLALNPSWRVLDIAGHMIAYREGDKSNIESR